MTDRPVILTIAGSDPSGGAGIQSDLRTIDRLGCAGLSAITAITVQSSTGVVRVDPVETVGEQIQALRADSAIDAVKIGMLGSAAQVDAVADALAGVACPIVLDPILASTGGMPLLDRSGLERLIERLLPLCSLITPNLAEAAILSGGHEDAGHEIVRMGAAAVLIKGGHSDGDPDDHLFLPDTQPIRFGGRRIETKETHGTGCLLSTAIAAHLGSGRNLIESIRRAKEILQEALAHPVSIGRGRGYPVPPALSIVGPRHAQIRGLYVITDPDLRPDRSPQDVVRAAVAGGAAVVQLRDKRMSNSDLLATAREIRAITRDAGVLFIVNDRIDIALAVDADGVHLGPDDMPPAEAARLLGPGRIVGVSTGTVEEAIAAAPFASYLGVGAVYGSSTKKDAGDAVGLERIHEIAEACPTLPIVGIGGITLENIHDVVAAGAHSAAVVSAVINAPDMETACRDLASAMIQPSTPRLVRTLRRRA